jgi:HAD superfamily hydrolase (TIGR01549 family)
LTRLPAPEAWLVDLDGTLYHSLPVKAAMGLELVLSGASHLGTLRRFRHFHELVRRDGTPQGDPYQEQLERAARALGRSTADVEGVVRVWMHERPARWLRLFHRRSLVREITAFRAGGGKTALVSDYPARVKLEGLGFPELFDVVVASGEPDGPPRLKPDPAGYLLAAERLGVRPEHCLVIGDRDDADGAAARAAGMAFRLMR